MFTSTRSIVAVGSCLLVAGLASAFALRASQTTDFENIPPDAEAVAASLKALDASLADAVRQAEKEIGGKAKSAEVDPDASPPSITVVVFADDAEHHVVFDARELSIMSKTTVPSFEFPGWAVEGEWTETASGLKYWDIAEGEGETAGANAEVTVHYTGYLLDGSKFDSSVDRGQPIRFSLQRVIPGWSEGVSTMREGGRRKLVIPYQLGYGERGAPPRIPPRAMLVFDVELITIHE